MVGTCKSSQGLPLSEELSGQWGMCWLESCLLGRYLFFWPPRPRPVAITSLEPGSGCSNKVERVGFLAGQERVIDQCHGSFPLSSCPRVHTKRSEESKAQKMLCLGVKAGMVRARTQEKVKHQLRKAQDLLNISKSGLGAI